MFRQISWSVGFCELDNALSVNDEYASGVIASLIIEDAIILSNRAMRPEVCQQWERQVAKATGELGQRRSAIYRNSQNLRILLFVLFSFRTEGREFSRSPAGTLCGEKCQYHLFPFEAAQRYRVALS
jgi:hypothetical protein